MPLPPVDAVSRRKGDPGTVSDGRYEAWITANVSDPHGRCFEWSVAMRARFPELRQAKGWYHELGGTSHCHWWCVAPDGTVVDPTRGQFMFFGDYEEITDPDRLPTGECMNCGGACFKGRPVCCGSCEDELAETFFGAASAEKGRQAE